MKKEKTKPSDHPVVVVVVIGTIPSKLNEVRSNLPIHVLAYDSAQQGNKGPTLCVSRGRRRRRTGV